MPIMLKPKVTYNRIANSAKQDGDYGVLITQLISSQMSWTSTFYRELSIKSLILSSSSSDQIEKLVRQDLSIPLISSRPRKIY
jgi:hypothetical protein